MRKSTYISIDLDFWMNSSHNEIAAIYSFLEKIYRLKRPITLVKHHHEILLHLNRYKFDRLINIDFHSDITDLNDTFLTRCQLNEGTWVNYVQSHNRTEFIWNHPSADIQDINNGKCHCAIDVFSPLVANQFCWQSVSMQLGLPDLTTINSAIGFCICTSPQWLRFNHTIPFTGILTDIGITSKIQAEKLMTRDDAITIKKLTSKIFRETKKP